MNVRLLDRTAESLRCRCVYGLACMLADDHDLVLCTCDGTLQVVYYRCLHYDAAVNSIFCFRTDERSEICFLDCRQSIKKSFALAVTGGGSVGECGRLSQPFGRSIIVIFTYLLTSRLVAAPRYQYNVGLAISLSPRISFIVRTSRRLFKQSLIV